MKILITGSDGFIGKHLVRFLDRKNYNYIGISRRSSSKKTILCDPAKFNDAANWAPADPAP